MLADRAAPDGNHLDAVDGMLAGWREAAGHRCLCFPTLLPVVCLSSPHCIIGGGSLNPGHLHCSPWFTVIARTPRSFLGLYYERWQVVFYCIIHSSASVIACEQSIARVGLPRCRLCSLDDEQLTPLISQPAFYQETSSSPAYSDP